MILANLTKAIREQNYYAVVLEFLIVIAGVVIGFQITAWNAERQDAAIERALLESLYRDFTAIVEDDQERHENALRAPEQVRALNEVLRAGPEPDDQEMIFRGLTSSINAMAITSVSATYDELKATGALSRLSSDRLRRLLASFERGREVEVLLQEQTMNYINAGPVFDVVKFDHDTGPHVGEGDYFQGEYDWEALREEDAYFQRMIHLHRSSVIWRERSRQRAVEILEELDRTLS